MLRSDTVEDEIKTHRSIKTHGVHQEPDHRRGVRSSAFRLNSDFTETELEGAISNLQNLLELGQGLLVCRAAEISPQNEDHRPCSDYILKSSK